MRLVGGSWIAKNRAIYLRVIYPMPPELVHAILAVRD